MSLVIEEMSTKVRMRREIGVMSSMGIIIGAVIGSGIFVSPVAIVRQCQSVGLSLLVWVLGGVLVMGMLLSYVELSLMFPRAGGDYAYIKIINGPVVAFIRVYVEMIMIRPTACAIMAMTTVDYLMVGMFGRCVVSELAVKMLSACLIVIIIVINCLYIRYTTTLQNITTMAKCLSLVVIIVCGLSYIYKGNSDSFDDPFEGSTREPGNIAIAIFSGMFSYAGWKHVFGLIEEVKTPERTLPLASIISITVIITIYLLANVAYLGALSPEVMSKSPSVAMSFAEVTMGGFSRLIPFMVASSTIGSLNCAILGGSRVVFAAARDGLFPGALSLINTKYLTPWVSMFTMGLISFFYLFSSDALTLINYQSFISVCFQILTVVNLIYLRYTRPDIKRPFKLFIVFPITVSIFTISLIILGIYNDPIGNGISVCLAISGIPVYYAMVKNNERASFINKLSEKVTLVIQKILLVVPEE